jgi:shikimate kinase
MIITLLGYMGSGKSTIGKQLASVLKYDFIDLDKFIEKKENLPIKEIFKIKGEIYFRKIEKSCLKEIYSSKNDLVLALGGGTPCFYGNMDFINSSNSTSIYLKLLPKILSKRLFIDKNNRPLINHLKTEDSLLEFIAIHLFERQLFYSNAKHTIAVGNESVNDVVNAILAKLK